jgi:hypothetical protein
MRRGLCVWLSLPLAFALGARSARGFEAYTLGGDVPFQATIPGNGSVVRGTFQAVSAGELDSWDLSTSGQDAEAPPGTLACADLGFNPFASCPLFVEGAGDQADVFVFRLGLDGDSGPVSGTGPSFSVFVDDAAGGSAYIIPADPGERIPGSSSGGFFFFNEPTAGTDPQFFIQPGESTVWLLSRFTTGEVAAALAGGATLRISVCDNSALMGIQCAYTSELAVTRLPEPEGLLPGALALASAIGASRAARRRRRSAAATA